jgi:hypothetical protein
MLSLVFGGRNNTVWKRFLFNSLLAILVYLKTTGKIFTDQKSKALILIFSEYLVKKYFHMPPGTLVRRFVVT